MNPYDYKISFRLRHPSLNLTTVSQKLSQLLPGISMGTLWNAGEEKITPRGRKLGTLNHESVMSFAFSHEAETSDQKTLEQSISETLIKLKPCAGLFHSFAKEGGSIEFFIGVFMDRNSGIIFKPELMRRIAALHAEIQLDIYPPDK